MIEAKNAFYAFDIVPGFWDCIFDASKAGLVRSPSMVFDEIAKGGDELSDWVKVAKEIDLFAEPNKSAQSLFGGIAQHVTEAYEQARTQKFLAGADPWVIAIAAECGGTVVTQETLLLGPGVKKIKIPNVCKYFDVSCVNVYQMLRTLEVKLVNGK